MLLDEKTAVLVWSGRLFNTTMIQQAWPNVHVVTLSAKVARTKAGHVEFNMSETTGTKVRR